jgi:hypothetical protein
LTKVLRLFKFLRFVRLIRALKLKNIFQKLNDYLDTTIAIKSLMVFFKLFIVMIILGHWIACLFHLVGISSNSNVIILNKV